MSSTLKLSLLLLIGFHSFAGFCQSKDYEPSYRYSVQDLQTDFQFVRSKLEKVHPALYLYTPKTELNLFFDSLYNSIVAPLTEQEFYNIITLLNSKIKDGHTMFLPSGKSRNYFNQSSGFLPFYFIVLNDKLYVNMNCSADNSIKDGAEIISLNGLSTKDILGQLLKRQIRDGDNGTYPVWILTTYFKDYYSFSFGHPEEFSIEYKNQNSSLQTTTIKSLSRDSIRYYKQVKYSARIPASNEKQGIILETNSSLSTATLTIKSFDNDILESEYKQDFRSTIEKMFADIRNSRVSNLILDIRNNQGGDWEPARILLSYLALQPMEYLKSSAQQRTIIPAENNFTGSLYVLINGGSFSNSGITSSCLELAGRATFIGEETAGNKTVINGEPRNFIIPNTKIYTEISSRNYLIRSTINDGHGVVPSHTVIPVVDDIITGKDTAKEFVLNLISKKGSK